MRAEENVILIYRKKKYLQVANCEVPVCYTLWHLAHLIYTHICYSLLIRAHIKFVQFVQIFAKVDNEKYLLQDWSLMWPARGTWPSTCRAFLLWYRACSRSWFPCIRRLCRAGSQHRRRRWIEKEGRNKEKASGKRLRLKRNNEANLKTERYMIRNVSDIIIHFAKTPL
jgi:hypothetical protein